MVPAAKVLLWPDTPENRKFIAEAFRSSGLKTKIWSPKSLQDIDDSRSGSRWTAMILCLDDAESMIKAVQALRERWASVPCVIVAETWPEDKELAAIRAGAEITALRDRPAVLAERLKFVLAGSTRSSTEEATSTSILDSRCQMLLNQLPLPLAIHNAEVRPVFVNDAFSRFRHVPSLDGEPSSHALASILGSETPSTLSRLSSFAKRLANGPPFPPETVQASDENGDHRTLLLVSDEWPDGHTETRLFVTLALDVTECFKHEERSLENEERLNAVVSSSVEGIVTVDEVGVIETVNPAAVRMFGYAADELIGKNVSVLMPSPYRDEHDGYIAKYRQTGERHIIGIGREVICRRKNGEVFPCDLSVSEAHLAHRRIFVGLLRDVSERKYAEDMLRKGKKELEHALETVAAKNNEIRSMTQQLWQAAKLASVGELAASVAHELNNPLATVHLRLESALAKTPADDPRRRHLEIVDQEVNRMGNLVANLLQFSRKGREECSTVDVGMELDKALELVHHMLEKRAIAVEKRVSPDTPVIFADRQKLRQVFLNLLTNAADAMPSGGTLTLKAKEIELDDGRPAVCVEFADTGAGIPSEHLDKVMEPFFTTKEEGRGTGLGLAICRRIVHEHHGSISLESTIGKGTLVRIALPSRSPVNVRPLR